ncbi:MAG: 1-acyl-sn-glycerol-3-phosphate acyltransferase [bacterium JZ-2024 1]
MSPGKQKRPFIPPNPRPAFKRLVTALNPILMPLLTQVYWVHCAEEDLRKLDDLRDFRMILCPNHTTLIDPAVMFYISRQVHGDYYFVAARELFDFLGDISAQAFSWLGVYSIDRGTIDRESLKTTVELLSSKPNKIVIFPEGLTYYQNDTLLPFLPGAFHIALMTLERLERAPGRAPPLYIVPAAIKYRLMGDVRWLYDRALARLETRLGIPRGTGSDGASLLRRILSCGEAVLARAERDYQITPGTGESVNDRIVRLRTAVLENLERRLRVSPAPSLNPIDRYRRLAYPISRFLTGVASEDERQEQTFVPSEDALREIVRDTLRIGNFLVIYEGYISEYPTQERFLDTLHRLEREVFGKFITKVIRNAFVAIGDPILANTVLPEYRRNPSEATHRLTRTVESAVSALLGSLKIQTTPLF